MTWVKLDDGWDQHPKVLMLSDAAVLLWLRGTTYAARMLTDGFLPRGILRSLTSSADAEALAAELVSAIPPGYEQGLWEPCNGGWMIHDYLDHNPSRADVTARRRADAARQAKHRSQRDSVRESQRDKRRESRHPVPSPPDPDPDPDPYQSPEGGEKHSGAFGRACQAPDPTPHRLPEGANGGRPSPPPSGGQVGGEVAVDGEVDLPLPGLADAPTGAGKGLTSNGGKQTRTGASKGQPEEESSAHKRVTDCYFAEYRNARGDNPPFGAREGKAVRELLEKLGGNPERACQCIRNAFADPFWRDKVTINTIAGDPAKFDGKRDAPRVHRPEPRRSGPILQGGPVPDTSIDMMALIGENE